MKTRNRAHLFVECLEDRWSPAVLLQLDAAGNLTGIFGTPAGNVDLFFTADDEVNVMENGNDLGTYSMPGNLTISLGNTTQSLTHTIDFDESSMSGNLSVTLGNSTGITTLDLINGQDTGIGGSLRIKTGSGADAVTLMADVGGSVNVNMGAGADTFTIAAGTDIQGSFVGSQINQFFLEDIGGPATVAGNLSLSTTEGIAVDYNFFGNNVDGNTVIGGNLLISTRSGAAPGDLVLLQGTVQGNVIVNLGSGPNTFTLDSTSMVLGNVTYRGGSGNDVVNFASDGVVLGNITASMGNGLNELTIDSNTTVGGSAITYVGGNGLDSITFRGNAPGARLVGYLGAGSDQVVFDDPAAVLASAYIDFGFGVDALFAPGFVFNFPVTFRNLP